jgi:myo-inositol-1-phosphate synthase
MSGSSSWSCGHSLRHHPLSASPLVLSFANWLSSWLRALDEHYAEIFMGGHQTISIFNVCEDSLLASPSIIDLVVIAEMMTRITWNIDGDSTSSKDYKGFHSVLSILSYMLKVSPITQLPALLANL